MPTIHLAFGPQWTLDAAPPWSVTVDDAGVLAMTRADQPHLPGAFACASLSVPIFNAPVRRLARFRVQYLAPQISGSSSANEATVQCHLYIDRTPVWDEPLSPGSADSGYREAGFNNPGGGHISVELRVEDAGMGVGPVRIVWSQFRLELPGFGETPGPWPPG